MSSSSSVRQNLGNPFIHLVTTKFFQVAADVTAKERPVENCGDKETNEGEGPDSHGEEHEGHDDALNG